MEQLIRKIQTYSRLPYIQDSIPGSILEAILADHYGITNLNTYDFVDDIDSKNKLGYQVKSTKESTPITWKRAKIPNKKYLIEQSFLDAKSIQTLGDKIIDYCNENALASIKKYKLEKINYARLIVFSDNTGAYFEKEIWSQNKPYLFDKNQFKWIWSKKRINNKKEQLPALNGIHIETGEKWFAWHGQGENQLHFCAERLWWPNNLVRFPLFVNSISLDDIALMA